MTRTSILSNGGLRIDLNNDGPTPNDPGDADPGANDLQNLPVLSSARNTADRTTIKGMLNSRGSTSFIIQFFSSPAGTDEGTTFVGKTTVTTDSSGNASFVFRPKRRVGAGKNITATATRNSTGDTSEFSAPRKVVAS